MKIAGASCAFDTLTPFLYPCGSRFISSLSRRPRRTKLVSSIRTCYSTAAAGGVSLPRPPLPASIAAQAKTSDHLNPSPDSYSAPPFIDCCTVTVHAGSGGHGCVSFVREKFIADGPPNGGDGGSGGNVYIQAVRGETSLLKVARKGLLRATGGKNGQGKGQGGQRGEDVVITVPVGTVVRELWRHDPVEAEEERILKQRGSESDVDEEDDRRLRREKWILYPGTLSSSFFYMDFPAVPRPRRSNLAMEQAKAPITLDLDKHMERPMLLAAGAVGGLGNPHFVTRKVPRPKFATKGESGLKLKLQLELKLLADVGLVGFPNAGKSTLLRALSNSRTRVGSWAFTTLQPQIGTVMLDSNIGRPVIKSFDKQGEPRSSFTIADIPGLIEDAHLDKGLGLGFLRHVERAATLAFVVDLSAGDAVADLQSLWREIAEYENMNGQNLNAETEKRLVGWKPFSSASRSTDEDRIVMPSQKPSEALAPLPGTPISSKPWFVVATKADLPDTEKNFSNLRAYLDMVTAGTVEHPSGKRNAWRRHLKAIPVSALNGEGVDILPKVIVDLFEQ